MRILLALTVLCSLSQIDSFGNSHIGPKGLGDDPLDQPREVNPGQPQCLDWNSISIPNHDSKDLVIGWKSVGKCTCTQAMEALKNHPEAVAAGYSPKCEPDGKFSGKQTSTRVGKTQTTIREWCADKETGTQLDRAVIVKPGVAPLTC